MRETAAEATVTQLPTCRLLPREEALCTAAVQSVDARRPARRHHLHFSPPALIALTTAAMTPAMQSVTMQIGSEGRLPSQRVSRSAGRSCRPRPTSCSAASCGSSSFRSTSLRFLCQAQTASEPLPSASTPPPAASSPSASSKGSGSFASSAPRFSPVKRSQTPLAGPLGSSFSRCQQRRVQRRWRRGAVVANAHVSAASVPFVSPFFRSAQPACTLTQPSLLTASPAAGSVLSRSARCWPLLPDSASASPSPAAYCPQLSAVRPRCRQATCFQSTAERMAAEQSSGSGSRPATSPAAARPASRPARPPPRSSSGFHHPQPHDNSPLPVGPSPAEYDVAAAAVHLLPSAPAFSFSRPASQQGLQGASFRLKLAHCGRWQARSSAARWAQQRDSVSVS